MVKQRVYVQLDALLDTRLATIAKLDPEAAVKALNDERYFHREVDDFEAICGISLTQFREAYEKRDVEILQHSRMTGVPVLLNELIGKMEQMETDTPYAQQIQVDVNYWPYELQADEVEAFQLAIGAFSGIETPVQMVRIHPMQLTPQHVKDVYSGLIMYDFRDWCIYHVKAIHQFPMVDVTVLAPALFYDRVPKREEIIDDPEIREDVTLFQLVELGFMENFQLQLLRPDLFSIARF